MEINILLVVIHKWSILTSWNIPWLFSTFFFLLAFKQMLFLFFYGNEYYALFLNWPRVTIRICKKIKISFDKLTIFFGYKCIECFFTFFLIGKSFLPWEIVCLWKANWKLETLKALVFVCVFFFSFFFI